MTEIYARKSSVDAQTRWGRRARAIEIQSLVKQCVTALAADQMSKTVMGIRFETGEVAEPQEAGTQIPPTLLGLSK